MQICLSGGWETEFIWRHLMYSMPYTLVILCSIVIWDRQVISLLVVSEIIIVATLLTILYTVRK